MVPVMGGSLDLILRLKPEVAIVDISMPVMNGLELTARLQGVDTTTRILALTANEDRAYLQQLLKMGVAGYLLKRSAADELIQAIRTVAAGRRYLDPQVVSELVQDLSIVPTEDAAPQPVTLSDREEEVMRFIRAGFCQQGNRHQAGHQREDGRDLQIAIHAEIGPAGSIRYCPLCHRSRLVAGRLIG